MPIHLKTNPYKGINAHFNSHILARKHGWKSFHNDHIAYLKAEINASLPDGYYAVSENSLQIQHAGQPPLPSTFPDIGILQASPFTPQVSGSMSLLEVPTVETDTFTEEEWMAVEIYQQVQGSPYLVTRVELLSPTNKQETYEYLALRSRVLAAGIHMVELDYLHTLPPLFPQLQGDYTRHEEAAYPYVIILAQATRHIGKTRFYSFSVDDPLPTLSIPLANGDSCAVNFDAAYQTWFSKDRRAHAEIDYSQLPAHFEAYSPHDQERIRAVMERIQQEHIDELQ